MRSSRKRQQHNDSTKKTKRLKNIDQRSDQQYIADTGTASAFTTSSRILIQKSYSTSKNIVKVDRSAIINSAQEADTTGMVANSSLPFSMYKTESTSSINYQVEGEDYEDSRLVDKMQEFSLQREAHRQRLLTNLMTVSMTIGVVSVLVDFTLIVFFRSTLLMEIFKSLLIVPSMICVYIPFFIPNDILNFNNESTVPWAFRIFVFFCSILYSYASPLDLNGFSIPRLIIGVSALFKGVGLPLTAHKQTLLMVVTMLGWAITHLYIGISSLLWSEKHHRPLTVIPHLGVPRSIGIGSYDALSLVIGVGYLIVFLVQLRCLRYAKAVGLCPSNTLRLSFFVLAAGVAFAFMVYAASDIIAGRFIESTSKGMTAIAFVIIVYLYFVIGPKRVFAVIARFTTEFFFRLYDRKEEHRVRDGAFLIEMLESLSADVGDVWWTHHDKCGRQPRMKYQDHRRYWFAGRVVRKRATTMEVQLLEGERSTVHFPLNANTQNANSADFIHYARSSLRCIDWESLSEELMTSASVRQVDVASFYSQSRPLRHGEHISFFISHSWSDDGALKYKALSRVASEYYLAHGRYPTFWFDKVCIDQQNILDGLRLLPLNIMMCERMLVLYGDTYAGRLWCIWELFTLMTFMSAEEAASRLLVVEPLHDGGAAAMIESLRHFDVSDARCYDPNEQKKLFAVIDATGLSEFNSRVRLLSTLNAFNGHSSVG